MPQRTWFITGVNSGFGRALTEQLLERGDRVAGTVRKLDAVKGLSEKYGDNFWVESLDLTDTADIRPVVDKAFKDLATVDVVINNAGYGLFGAAEEPTDEQVEDAIDTNLLGSIQVIRAALPHLRKQGKGRIIQISTFGGQAALPGGSMYHATKWGIEGFADAVGQEVGPLGIGVTIVEPGGARTEFRYGSAKLGPAIEAYAASPASFARKMIESGTQLSPGDPAKMAAAIIASADQTPAPKRVVLGTDSFTMITGALTARLADVQGQKDSASATDYPAGE